MNILLFGATGDMGQLVLKTALAANHSVKAFVRNPVGITLENKNLSVIKGNITDTASIESALSNVDVVVSTLGSKSFTKHDTILIEGLRHILEAMGNTSVKRLIFVSAFGVGETYHEAAFVSKILFSTLLRIPYADKLEQEKLVKGSKTDWTLIHPARLTVDPSVGKYQVGEHLHLSSNSTISRAGVADFIVKQVDSKDFIRKSVTIGS